MQIIDAQLHEIGPRQKWEGVDEATRHQVLTELMFGWMDSAGVGSALVNAGDSDWLRKVVVQFPDRLAGFFHLHDPIAPNVAEEVERGVGVPGHLGHRLSFGRVPVDPTGEKGRAKFESGAFNGLFAACQKFDRPLFCSAYGQVELVGRVARAYPNLRIIVDHMGIPQPPLNPRHDHLWDVLNDLVPLADYPNVNVKLCGVPVLSNEAYPFNDVWPHIHKIFKSFGVKRVMWASDIGRFAGRIGWQNKYEPAHGDYPGKHTYAEALFYILHTNQLSQAEKEEVLYGTASRVTGWSPKPRKLSVPASETIR